MKLVPDYDTTERFKEEAARTANGRAKNEDDDRTHAEILLDIASGSDLFHTPGGDTYVSFLVGAGTKSSPVQGRDFADWLRQEFHAIKGKPPAAQTLKNVVDVLSARAKYGGAEDDVHLRVAGSGDAIYVDLCNDAYEAVEITDAGWDLATEIPVRFRRTRGMAALPMPERGGSLELLRRHVRVKDDATFSLLLAFLVQALRPKGPYPALVLVGEHGTGKTTTSKIIRALVDPSTVPVRTSPREEHDLVIAAHNGWMLAFDNLSGLRPWMSDALCRIATGGGFGTRRLYENKEEELFFETRPMILNGIEDIATRPDLADRALAIELEVIPERERKTESEVWKAFKSDHPLILGALFDAVSVAIRNVGNVELDELPRMADFAIWAAAAEPSFPIASGTFIHAYKGNREQAVETTISSDSVAAAVRSLIDENDYFEGTTSELMEAAKDYLPEPEKPPRDYPKTVQAMTAALRRIAPALREVGIERIDLPRTPETRARIFRLEKEGTSTSTTSTTSQTARTAENGRSEVDEQVDKVCDVDEARPRARPPKNGLNGVKNADVDKVDEVDEPIRSLSNDEEWYAEMMNRADEEVPF